MGYVLRGLSFKGTKSQGGNVGGSVSGAQSSGGGVLMGGMSGGRDRGALSCYAEIRRERNSRYLARVE